MFAIQFFSQIFTKKRTKKKKKNEKDLIFNFKNLKI